MHPTTQGLSVNVQGYLGRVIGNVIPISSTGIQNAQANVVNR